MKRIIITGASSGIGKATAEKLAAKGHQLVVSARRTEALEELCERYPENVQFISCDVSDDAQVSAMVERCVQSFGGVDVLINNAGMGVFDPLIEAKLSDWHTMIDINIKGLLSCIHSALPHLIESKGHIINLGSVASHNVFANSGVYCATKHAVLAISEALRIEHANDLHVTTISPGQVNTEFIDQTSNSDLLKDYKPYFEAGMTASLIADQIIFAIETPPNAVISEIIVRPSNALS
ncbi:MAG: SDR family oxidoreductase [Flavobacteriales bacterium]|nr:SDR family oxidoreductase [Flavobacteriales bacterium]MDG1779939.1 SDR family oxidoreductase [Flavobacteriales bacterium]MDG2245743.1 SDR family oxidoreductase [Flavobacteriales bacterium]